MESRAGIPLAALLFFDCLQLVYRRLLALHQRGCRGRKVALDRPWQRWAIRSVLELGVYGGSCSSRWIRSWNFKLVVVQNLFLEQEVLMMRRERGFRSFWLGPWQSVTRNGRPFVSDSGQPPELLELGSATITKLQEVKMEQ